MKKRGLFVFLLLVFALFSNFKNVHAEAVHYLRPYQWTNMETYDSTNVENSFTMMGKKYTHGLKTAGGYWDDSYAEFNLYGEITAVSFKIGHIDNDDGSEGKLKLYLDGELQDNYTTELTSGMSVKDISINVNGKKQLRIYISTVGSRPRYGIGDIVFTGYHVFECEYTNLATVQNDGLTTYTCKDCGYKYTEKEPANTYCTNYIIPYQVENMHLWEGIKGSENALNIMGNKYYLGLSSSGGYWDNSKAYYNLNCSYSNVSFLIGHLDNDDGSEGKLNVYKDNVLIKTIELKQAMMVENVNINTTGITQLCIEIVTVGSRPRYGIFNIEATPVSTGNRQHSFYEESLVEAQFGIAGSIRHVCSVCGAFYVTSTPALTRDLSDKKISVQLSDKEYIYDGSEKKPTISVSYDKDKLVAGKDYSVRYSSNINPGEAKATITGMGGYTGSVTYTYKINAAKTSDKSIESTSVSNTKSKSSNNNTVLLSQISINIKNKKTYKKSKKVTISSNVYLRSVTLNGKNIITSNYLKKVSFKISKYKKKLKKKGKWNNLVVTNSYGKKKTIKFKTK